MRLTFVYILLFVGCYVPVSAQYNDIFTSYGVDDGLPQSSIWSIAEDNNGFLWFGTSDGVCRFDGYNFTVYRHNPNEKNSITGGLYFRFFKDHESNLWVISQNGISRYNAIKDNFTPVISIQQQLQADNYNYIFGEWGGYLWVGLTSGGLVKIDQHSYKMTKIKSQGNVDLTSIASWQSGIIDKGRIWMAGDASGCYIYDITANNVVKIYRDGITRIIDYNDSEILATTFKKVLAFNKKKLLPRTIADSISKNGITDIQKGVGADIIVSSPQGLCYIDPVKGKIIRRIRSFERGKEQSYSYAQCIFKDRSGNLWIGTNGDGLKKITAPLKRFKYYHSYSDKGNLVKAISANDDYVFIGNYNNGLDLFDKKTGFLKNITVNPALPHSNNVFAIAKIDKDHFAINTEIKNALYIYGVNQSTSISLTSVLNKILPNAAELESNHPFFLKKGDTLYSNVGDRLVAFDVHNFKKISAAVKYQFTDETLTCGFIDHKDNIWIGSLNGAYCIKNNTANKIVLPETIQVKTINEDIYGNIWLGTIRGIYIADSNQKIVKYLTDNNGLSNQFIYGILRDRNGDMWFSHNKGISEYLIHTNTFRHFTHADGLQSNEFNTGAYYETEDGELFFGGINGTNSFYPNEIQNNPNIPKVCVTSVKIFDEALKTDTAYWNIHTLNLPYSQNSISFEFAALEFTDPKKNQYAYMLEGLDNSWISAGDKHFARYGALAPGQYTFKIKARNNDGVWQKNPTQIYINIAPPYWQRLWFKLLSVLLLAGSTVGAILWLQRQRHKKKLNALELQQKIQLERERISRDLHDNVGTQLSLISNNIEWITHPLKEINEAEKAEKLQFVNDTARDIIATLRETIWALNRQEIHLEEFSDKLKAFVQKQLAIYPNIELDLVEEINEPVILGPSEALDLFRICQEAFVNSLKYAHATRLEIGIKSNNGKYTITLKDNGVGFDVYKVNPAIQNGLENMQYRASDINCIIKIETSINNGTCILIIKQ